MDNRREFLKKSMLLSGAAGFSRVMPSSIQRALNINPKHGSTYLNAEHVVILMQENRSFDHCFGSLQGVRGFNDPRAIELPNGNPVWLQTNEQKETYAPFRLDIRKTKITWMGSLPHVRSSQVDASNNGKHDGWLAAKKSGNKKYAGMPLTLGHYIREDLPFNYALADAFTVCDQSFCSAMTSTTPNRAYFWTGNIKEEKDGRVKANIRNEDYDYAGKKWKTFPELLQDNNIKWKFYQNEISCGGGFKGNESGWLGNFGCNNLEFFSAYNVKFSPRYVEGLRKNIASLPTEIEALKNKKPNDGKDSIKIQKAIAKKQEVVDKAKRELLQWNRENYEALTQRDKNLNRDAFVINSGDASYRKLAELDYSDENGNTHKVSVPDGDVLFQFRKDVETRTLPTVSWLTAPQNFSDHPSAPWYGAWYVSEILDILTKNPEVWKKTIFILTYDENDGYYDHVPAFSICDNKKPETGKCSNGIDTEAEFVRLDNELAQGINKNEAREAPIGLGFRVPMIIASPWSRGGKVCSQLFEHTSTLQFLETFLNQKFKKNIHLDNISAWRRTIAGDLTSAFTPFDAKQEKLPFLNRDKFVESIYNAKFKGVPKDFKQLSEGDINEVKEGKPDLDFMPVQEKGIRVSNALPYELYVDGAFNTKDKNFEIKFEAANKNFGADAVGSPFTVYVPEKFDGGEKCRNWSFAVKAGDVLNYAWSMDFFENNQYHLRVNAPNGFYRAFKGSTNDPMLTIMVKYE